MSYKAFIQVAHPVEPDAIHQVPKYTSEHYKVTSEKVRNCIADVLMRMGVGRNGIDRVCDALSQESHLSSGFSYRGNTDEGQGIIVHISTFVDQIEKRMAKNAGRPVPAEFGSSEPQVDTPKNRFHDYRWISEKTESGERFRWERRTQASDVRDEQQPEQVESVRVQQGAWTTPATSGAV